ncbi:MAG: hypothetical protein LBK03_04020 [Bacteroidales bacterium]|jgi:hypothetical protein|nr:hypothetical protein [Bacteroidales bacterium]
MKKLVFLAVASVVGMAHFTACTRVCQCKVYVADKETNQRDRPLDKSRYKKCSDMDNVTIIGGQKYGEVCQQKLL